MHITHTTVAILATRIAVLISQQKALLIFQPHFEKRKLPQKKIKKVRALKYAKETPLARNVAKSRPFPAFKIATSQARNKHNKRKRNRVLRGVAHARAVKHPRSSKDTMHALIYSFYLNH